MKLELFCFYSILVLLLLYQLPMDNYHIGTKTLYPAHIVGLETAVA